jgi:thiol-disulfide isomerase/thioredoxin
VKTCAIPTLIRLTEIAMLPVLLSAVWRLPQPVAASPNNQPVVGAPAAPHPAPDFALKDLSGKTVRFTDYPGKVVLLDFWATWCGSCVTAMPKLQKLHDRLAAKGFTVIGIATDAQGAVKVAPVVAKKQVKYPVLLGNETAWGPYEVQFLPTLILIDRKGQIVKRFESVTDFALIEKAVERVVLEGSAGS